MTSPISDGKLNLQIRSRFDSWPSSGSGEFRWSEYSGVLNLDKNWDQLGAVETHRDKVSGAWVFRGTRVPVAALFENLRDGATVDQFLEWFPGVNREDVESVLNHEVAQLTNSDAA